MNRIVAAALAAFFFVSPVAAQYSNDAVTGASGGGGSGTVTQIDTACGVSGGPITTTGTVQGAAVIRAATGTSDTVLSSDCGKVVTESNAAAVAVTLPQATGSFAAPFFYTQINLGAGTVTITPTTSTINGAATLVLTTGQSADIVSDGTNYVAALGKGGTATTDASLLTSGTLAAARLPAFTGDCTTSAGSSATTCEGLTPLNYTASFWYGVWPASSMATGATFTASQIYCRLHQFPRTVTFLNVGLNVMTGGGGNIQIAYYANTSNLPGTLIQNTGSISTTTNGNKSGALGGNVQAGPASSNGRNVWICVNSDNATHIMAAYSTGYNVASVMIGGPAQSSIFVAGNSLGLDNISCSGANCNGGSSTFGTWPASLAGSTWTYNTQVSRFPVQQFQVVSSP